MAVSVEVKTVLVVFIGYLSLAGAIWPAHRRQAQSSVYIDPQAEDLPPNHYWFTNKLDHFDPLEPQTYRQLYWVNDTYYKPGGPVFLFLGGEAPVHFFDFQEVSALAWAQKYNALYVALEHRFYGISNPKPSLATHHLKFLSSQQALADAANFVSTMQSSADPRFHGKWVVLGCSYSGALSAWFRSKYPHLVVGSLAPSAPVWAVWNFTQFFNNFYTAAPTSCVQATQQATNQMAKLLETKGGRAQLGQLFNSCYPLESQEDIFNFKNQIVTYLGTTPQWQNPPGNNLTLACTTLTQNSNYVQNWALSFIQQTGATSCTSFRLSDYIGHLKDEALGNLDRSWYFQTCAEFGYYATSYNGTSPFFTDLTIGVINSWCEKIFGISRMTPNTAWTNAYYGGLNVAGSNILFTNGIRDPWHTLGINNNVNVQRNVMAVTYDAAHCAVMDAPDPADTPSLTQARLQIVQWLGQLLQSN